MVYGIIYLIPQQVRLFIDKQWLYITILSLGISTFTGMFSVVFWLTIATDVWELRKKWPKSHVIYFSILTNDLIRMRQVWSLTSSNKATDLDSQNYFFESKARQQWQLEKVLGVASRMMEWNILWMLCRHQVNDVVFWCQSILISHLDGGMQVGSIFCNSKFSENSDSYTSNISECTAFLFKVWDINQQWYTHMLTQTLVRTSWWWICQCKICACRDFPVHFVFKVARVWGDINDLDTIHSQSQ